ncbi:MAG: hypothetical protein ACSLFO_09775 [Acidimicrobiales bacterium]
MDAWDDAELEHALRRGRARRQRMAQVMVAVLLIPLAIQGVLVSSGLAVRFGLIVVILPLVVIWRVRRGRA